MGQITFVTSAPEAYRQAVLSTLLTPKNLGTIALIFFASLIVLMFLRFIKSFVIKLLIALLITGVFALYLYLKISPVIYL